MLIGLLYTLFVILCVCIILIILFQKSKGSLGLVGSIGGAGIVFGGSGGQDMFQKMTWIFVGLFLGGSLLLAILKNRSVNHSQYLAKAIAASAFQLPAAPAPESVPQQQIPEVPSIDLPVSQQ